MQADKKQMAQILSNRSRLPYLRRAAQLINTTAKRILDLGCGIGALIPILHEQVPNASIVGIDLSTDLLGVFNSNHRMLPVCSIQGRMPEVPIQESSLDAITAVQSLHEVFHFMGEGSLKSTLQKAHSLLSTNGVFIAMDHQNPGEVLIEAQIPGPLIEQLHYFAERFQPRHIHYELLHDDWIRISKRDLHDFITKKWSFGTPLENEEMHETHTPFTGNEIRDHFQQAGFVVNHLETVRPMASTLKSSKIRLEKGHSMPGRYFLLRAEKV